MYSRINVYLYFLHNLNPKLRLNPNRSCKCTDITGESVDLNQCDAGLDDYSRKVMCEGDSCKFFEKITFRHNNRDEST